MLVCSVRCKGRWHLVLLLALIASGLAHASAEVRQSVRAATGASAQAPNMLLRGNTDPIGGRRPLVFPGAGTAGSVLHLRGGAAGGEAGMQVAIPGQDGMRQLVSSLMSPDNAVRMEAEKQYGVLKEKAPDECSLALVHELAAGNEEGRAMAAVLARTELSQAWEHLTVDTQTVAKQQLLARLQAEESASIARKIANVVGGLSYHVGETDSGWPELIPTVLEMCGRGTGVQREMGYHVLSLLPGSMHAQVKQELPRVQALLEAALVAPAPVGDGRVGDQHAEVQVAAMKAVSAYLGSCNSPKEMKPLQPLLSHMLRCIGGWLGIGAQPPAGLGAGGALAESELREISGRAGMDALLEISDVNVRFLKPHLADLTTAMLGHVAINANLESATRRLAVELMVELAEKAPGMMKNHKGFVQQIVTVALQLMVAGVDSGVDLEVWSQWGRSDGEDDSEQEEDGEEQALFEQGLEALDRLAMIPSFSSKIMPACFSYVPQFLSNPDWRYRLVALFSISQTGEGCGREMKKHLAELVASILPLLQDPNPRVRWAATNCIGQLSTDLGPALQTSFHSQILPALTATMDASRESNLRVRAHAAAATINFCEKAEKEAVAPYLEGVLRQLAALMQAPHRKAQEQSITTVAALALAVGDLFVPYYQEFVPFLKSLLRLPAQQCGGKMRGKTLECVSLIGVAVGAEKFRDDALEVMQLIVAEGEVATDDPAVTYLHQACGRICRCLGAEFAPFLPSLLPGLLRSANLEPDIRVEDDLGSDEDLEGMETIQVGDAVVGIKTSVLEEKATACHLLVTYINQLEDAFFPYLEQVGKEMKPLLSFLYHEDVRVSAIQAMSGMVRSASAHVRKNQADPAIVSQVLKFVLPDLLRTLEEETETGVAAQCGRGIAQCVQEAGATCLTPEQLAATSETLTKVLEESKQRIVDVLGSQAEREDDEEEDDDYEEELEEEVRMVVDAEEELVEAIITVVGKLLGAHGPAGLAQLLESQLLPPFLAMIDNPVHPSQVFPSSQGASFVPGWEQRVQRAAGGLWPASATP